MKYLLSFILLISSILCFSQNGLQQVGARTAGTAYTSASIEDRWAVINNPAGIGSLNETSAIFSFENKFNVEGLNTMAAGILTPAPGGAVGISLFRFGDDLYSEQTASLSYGNKFGIASLGFRVNYLQYNIEGFGTKGVFTLDFGGIAGITPHLLFGAYIRNVNQAKLAELADERAPTVLNAGLSYRPTDKVIFNIEAEKDIDYEAFIRVGLEYKFLKKLAVRTGIRTDPFINYFGLGIALRKLTIDYALTPDPLLGISHQASVAYVIRQKE